MQLGHRPGVPAEHVVQTHHRLDRGDRGGRHRPQLDVHRPRVQQPLQRHHRGPGAGQLVLQPLQVPGHQRGAGAGVGGAQHRPDVVQGQVQRAQLVDDLGGGDLVGE